MAHSSADLAAQIAGQGRTKGNADAAASGGGSGKTVLVVGSRRSSKFGRRK